MNNSNITQTDYPLVSVIVPIYNAEKYLERSLTCLHKQTYPNLEFILIDDGSTDNSWKICEEYRKKDSRFKTYHITNSGASLARKYGLNKSIGEYISFIDADDYIDNNYIEQLHSLIIKFKVNISSCKVMRVKTGQVINRNSSAIECLLKFDELMPRYFKYEFWGFPGKLYKKSIFDNIIFPSATLSEDYFVMAQLFINERSMAYTDANLYYYEYHPNSLSHTKLSNRAFEEFENVNAVYELIKDKAPLYLNMALSNVVETCIKLISMGQRASTKTYSIQLKKTQDFLKTHMFKIILTNAIYWKLKIVALKLIIFQ